MVSPEDNNPYNIRTRKILKEFYAMGISESSGNVIFYSGNALKYLGEYFDENTDYKNPYKEDPKDIRAIRFSVNGDILGGNINNKSIFEIMDTYAVSE